MEKKLNYIVPIFLAAVTLVWMYLDYANTEEQKKMEDILYPEINKLTQSISGTVFYARSSSVWNGALLVSLTNTSTFSVSEPTYNWDYRVVSFDYFIKENDSIYKPINSDSIYVYRNGKEYYFIYGKILNKK